MKFMKTDFDLKNRSGHHVTLTAISVFQFLFNLLGKNLNEIRENKRSKKKKVHSSTI